MRGQITFFDFKKHFGIIVAEVSGEQHFFSGHDLSEPVKLNAWVEFDSEPKIEYSGSKIDWHAKNIYRIECPPEFLLYGHIHSFFPDKHFGFVNYDTNGRTESIFFHCSDMLRIDGVEPVPCVGCKVSFCLGHKTDRPIACQIRQHTVSCENIFVLRVGAYIRCSQLRRFSIQFAGTEASHGVVSAEIADCQVKPCVTDGGLSTTCVSSPVSSSEASCRSACKSQGPKRRLARLNRELLANPLCAVIC